MYLYLIFSNKVTGRFMTKKSNGKFSWLFQSSNLQLGLVFSFKKKKDLREKRVISHFQLWQLETLLLQRDTYMNYSRPLSTASVSWSQNISSIKPRNVMHRLSFKLRNLILEKWQRAWILSLWVMIMVGLFVWKFLQYKNKAAFHVMGYCLASAKGAAETLKLNMALILLPVCRNTLTWLRSTRARSFVPFDENINFHKVRRLTMLIIYNWQRIWTG